MKIIIVRHGKTTWNDEGKAAGQTDVKLNEKGRDQARQIRDELNNISVDTILTSPLSRAIETANIINENKNVPIIIEQGLIERNLGIYEGQPNENEVFNKIRYYNKNIFVEGGEDTKTFTKRVFEFLEYLTKEYNGKADTIVLVTHGFFLRSADWYFNGLPNENEIVKRFGNCQMDIYEI